MREQKISFIKYDLTPLVRACSNVKELVPEEDDGDDINYVQIIYKNGYMKRVNIMCDSLLAIAKDVIKKIV